MVSILRGGYCIQYRNLGSTVISFVPRPEEIVPHKEYKWPLPSIEIDVLAARSIINLNALTADGKSEDFTAIIAGAD